MQAIEWIAEQRIREAIEQGKLDNLPGSGKPIRLEVDSHLPPELRLAYTILRNAGFVPPIIELRRRIEDEAEALDCYLETCRRYASQYLETIRALAARAARRGDRRHREGEKAAAQLAALVQAYQLFRERCRENVQLRLERIAACVDQLQREWLRESSRRAPRFGLDLGLLSHDPQQTLLRFESAVPELEPWILEQVSPDIPAQP
ncbi:MAG: DUF1992 domain-containing protein [candidate division KSB1 bacterium]|nr:DUF1992 domain-containing protein [candidate division KSB1 bacterium]